MHWNRLPQHQSSLIGNSLPYQRADAFTTNITHSFAERPMSHSLYSKPRCICLLKKLIPSATRAVIEWVGIHVGLQRCRCRLVRRKQIWSFAVDSAIKCSAIAHSFVLLDRCRYLRATETPTIPETTVTVSHHRVARCWRLQSASDWRRL